MTSEWIVAITWSGCADAACLTFRKLQSHRAVAFWIFEPVLAHLHEQKEVHIGLVGLGNLLARRRADRLQRSPALADHDFLVAVAADENRLLDPRGAVGEILPGIRLDRGLIRQFVVQP